MSTRPLRSMRSGIRTARDTAPQTLVFESGVHRMRALGSHSNPVKVVRSNLDPRMTLSFWSMMVVSLLKNALDSRRSSPAGMNRMNAPGAELNR